MRKRIVSEARERAFATLLEDPSPVVQEALKEAFAAMGREGLEVLDNILRTATGKQREHGKEIRHGLSAPDPSEVFVDFIRSLNYDLESGLFLINRVIHPEVEIDGVRKGLEALASRFQELDVRTSHPRQRCQILNRVLFHEAGFRGNTEHYEDPMNSCLEAVFRTRRGLPILLSSIYILVGQRVGIELEPIGLPGHFLVGCFQGHEPLYIDPFDRGRFRTVDDVRQLLLKQLVAPQMYHLAPIPVSQVLSRVCLNLVHHFDAQRETRWANRFRRFVREFEETYRRHSEA